MNKTFMNTVSLAKDPFIRKGEGGGGGGVTINNQEKSLEITENGVTEVTADAGFTGLSKVIVNTNVASSGGGGGSDMPVIGDGKTYLYITIAAEGRMNVPLYFSQTVSNGVTIDWGDGSAPQTLSGTGSQYPSHKYAEIGDYVISLDPVDGCTLGLGRNRQSSNVVADLTYGTGKVESGRLRMVEIGKNVPIIDNYAFYRCRALSAIVIPNTVTSIGNYAFEQCNSVLHIAIPNTVTSIGNYAFSGCSSLTEMDIPSGVTSIKSYMIQNGYSLARINIPSTVATIDKYAFAGCDALVSMDIPSSVTSIGESAFENCSGMAFYDFSKHSSIPSLGRYAFNKIASDCKIIVPDALYDEWIAATNWSSLASKIIKKSDWDASQS